MFKKIENPQLFIKKTAKNTLKHLKGKHPDLTLSELTEAMSKALGFNNYYSAKQEKNQNYFTEKESLDFQEKIDETLVDELTLYYPHTTMNIYEYEAMNLGNIKAIVSHATLEKEDHVIHQKINTANKLKKQINRLLELMPACPVEDYYEKLHNSYRQKILLKLKQINKENVLEELKTIIKDLITDDFKTKYKEILISEEAESYSNFNFQKETIESLLLNVLYVLNMAIENKINKISSEINVKDCFLYFFRLLLNNNLFCASYKEKVIKLLSEEKDFILRYRDKKINILYSFQKERISQKKIDFINNKLDIFKQSMLCLYPNLNIHFKEQKERMYDDSMFFYDEKNKEVNIHLFDYFK